MTKAYLVNHNADRNEGRSLRMIPIGVFPESPEAEEFANEFAKGKGVYGAPAKVELVEAVWLNLLEVWLVNWEKGTYLKPVEDGAAGEVREAKPWEVHFG